jgi:GNAT superfamily N-acetyltransferase
MADRDVRQTGDAPPLRALTSADLPQLLSFVLMAVFPPGQEVPSGAEQISHVRRWLDPWDEEVGVGGEDEGALVGAARARRVEPVIVRNEDGEPLPEVIVSVAPEARASGLGSQLMKALLARASAAGCGGLALTVSERNPVAVRLHIGIMHQVD